VDETGAFALCQQCRGGYILAWLNMRACDGGEIEAPVLPVHFLLVKSKPHIEVSKFSGCPKTSFHFRVSI